MAEQIVGNPWSSYNQTVQHILQMDDMIHILSPQDIPLTAGVGGDGVPILPSSPVVNRVWYWQEESEPQPYGTIAEALDNVETDIDVTDGTAANWAVGDHIRIDDEIVKVTAITTSGAPDVLTVTRGAVGTTAAAHSSGAAMIGLGTVLPEGDLGSASYLGRDSYSNYTQIFSGQVSVTRTEQSIPKYGVPNELVKQMAARMKHLMLGIENAAVYGVKHETSATRIRSTGGYKSFVTSSSVIDSTNTWMTLARVEALLAAIFNNGGDTNNMVLVSHDSNFAALNNLTDTGRVRVVDVGDSRRGRQPARVLVTEYGEVTLARDRRLKLSDGLLYSSANFRKRVFQPLITFPLAKTDDTDKFGMVAELGFEVRGVGQNARFSALDPTQALPASGLV